MRCVICCGVAVMESNATKIHFGFVNLVIGFEENGSVGNALCAWIGIGVSHLGISFGDFRTKN